MSPFLRTLYILIITAAIMFLLPRSSVFNAIRTSSFKPITTATKTNLNFLRTFSTSSSTMSSAPSQPFLDALASRRTIYTLSDKSPVPDSRIISIVEQAVKHVPSSFNVQSTRALVLLKDEHKKLWDITSEVLKPIVPDEAAWAGTSAKLAGFKNAYGSVLFFEDQDAVKGLQNKFPLYQDRFPDWSVQTDGMHQLAVWTALELEGFGASLQHYNPLIDQRVQATWGIHPSWKLQCQLVFGTPTAGPGEKTFAPLEERIKVFGADA